MAISDQQIFDWFLANPEADDATIASTMDQFKVSPADVARATGTDLSSVESRYQAAAPTDYFTQQFGADTSGIASLPASTSVTTQVADTGLASLPGADVTVANTPVVTTTPTDTSAFNYESVYDVFGGKDATNDLITTFRSMGLDDNAIASVFAPYRPTTTAVTTTPTTVVTTPTTAAVTTTPTTAVTTTPTTSVIGATGNDTVTGDTTNNELSGVILAGDSWLAGDDFTSIADTAFDETVTNTAIGGQTTADVLNQLNVFERDGGTFAPGSTVILSIGGNDLATGVDRNTIRDNLNEIVSRLGALGVKVVLSGAPDADSYNEAITSTNLVMDNLYNEVAANNSNVTLVDVMSGLLNQKDLMDASGFHLKDEASKTAYFDKLEDAYRGLSAVDKAQLDSKLAKIDTTDAVAVAQVVDSVAGTNIASQTTTTADSLLTNTATENAYFKANPDVAAAYAANSYGLTPEQFAQDHYTYRGAEEGRKSPFQESGEFKNAVDLKNGTYLTTTGAIVDSSGSAIKNTGSASTVKLTEQILGQNLTDKWQGEGFGSAQANAADMAGILASIGITDIRQFGLITKEVPTYSYDDYGNQIETGTQTVQVYGNKLTGQEVPNTYSERQTGNAFGGTFAGSGNTGYRVQFAPDGTPVFYTTKASSNDLANLMADLGPIGQIGLALATGGLSIPQQIAANLAVNVLSGKDLGDSIKSAAISFAGAQIPGMDFMSDGASFIKDLGLSPDLTKTLTNSFQNAAVSAGTALLSGQDVGEAMLRGAATGGVNGAVNSLLGNVEGFGDLTANQKKIVTNAVTGVISGKPLDQIVINSAIAAANNAVKEAKTTNVSDGSDVISTLQNAGLTEDQLADANLFGTGEKLTVSADAQGIIDELAAIKPDELAFVGPASGLGSAAATQTAALLQRAAATPAGQEALRQAATVSTTVRDALIASGVFTAAGLTSFIAGNQLVPAKIDTVTQTTNTDLVNQIPRDTIDSLVNRTVTPTTQVQTATAQPTTQVATTAPTTYVVQPGDYSDTTEELQPWQSINPTTQVAQPDASRLASMLGVNVDTAANLLRIYPSLFGEDESFTPADIEKMTSTDIRLMQSAGGGADDNIVTQKPSNDTVVARDSEGQPITYGDLINIIGTNKVITQPTTIPTTQSTVNTQPTVQVTPTTQVTNQATTTPTTEATTRVTPTTEVITETTPTTETTTKPTTEVTTEVTPTTATQTTVTPTTEATTKVTPTTTPTTEVTTQVTPTTTPTTEVTTKPTTEATTKVTPTTEVTTKTTPTTETTTKVTPTTETTTKPTTATQTTVTPTTATQATVTPTTATQTTVKPTTATQATVTPTTATQTTTTPTTATQTTTKPTTATQTTTTPTTATQTTTTPTTATQTTTTPTTATQTTVTPTTATQTTTTPTTATQTTVTPTTATVTPTTATVTPTTATVTPTVATVTPTVATVTPTVSTVTPTTTTTTPTTTTTVKPTVATVKPTVKSTVSGYTMPQAQNIAAAFGIPALANVFYYGKDFGSKKQKLDKKGEVVEEEYRPLSVTKAGAEGEMLEDIAQEQKNKENNTNDALDLVLGKSSDAMSIDELLNIVKGG